MSNLTVNFTVNQHASTPTKAAAARSRPNGESVIKGYYCYVCDREVETFLTESYTLVCKHCMASFVEVLVAPPTSTKAAANKLMKVKHRMKMRSAVNLSYTARSDDVFEVQISPSPAQAISNHPTPASSSATRRPWFSSLFSRRAGKSATTNGRANAFVTVFSGKQKSPYSDSKKFAASTVGFEENYDECPICHDELFVKGKDTLRLTCRHAYHRECIHDWLDRSGTCPYCRQTASVATFT